MVNYILMFIIASIIMITCAVAFCVIFIGGFLNIIFFKDYKNYCKENGKVSLKEFKETFC